MLPLFGGYADQFWSNQMAPAVASDQYLFNAQPSSAGAEARANGDRPPWSFAQPPVPAVSKKGLKTAKDKEPALLPPPPKTLPPSTKKK